MSGMPRQRTFIQEQWPVVGLKTTIQPGLLRPLYWYSLARLSDEFQESFGGRFPVPIHGVGWSRDKEKSQRLAIEDARAKLARLKASGSTHVPYLPEKARDQNWSRVARQDFSRAHSMLRRRVGQWEVWKAGKEPHFVVSIIRLRDEGIIIGYAEDPDLESAIERSGLCAYDRWLTFERIRSGEEQLLDTMEHQDLWYYATDRAAADGFMTQACTAGLEPFGVWSHLFRYAWPRIARTASRQHLDGFAKLGLDESSEPDLTALSDHVKALSGWELVRARGEVPAKEFFALLAEKKFPLVHEMRPPHQAFASAEPDLWHEVMGHVPLLFDEGTGVLYQFLGKLAQEHLEAVTKLYWYIAEYGLIRQDRQEKILGAGLLASPLGPDCLEHRKVSIQPFSVEKVLQSTFDPYRFQARLFVIPSVAAAMEQISRASGLGFRL